MKTTATFALFCLVAMPALAETSAQRSACVPDVWRLCASEIPDAGAITQCLRRERARLGAECRLVMDEADRPVRAVANRK